MAQPTPPTPTGKLSDVARHVVLPSGVVSTGWPAVRDTCKGFGVSFDPWQDGAGRAILAKRANGSYACTIGGAVISIPRQVGKTFLLGAIVFALCLLQPGLTVIWTAHRLRTANETFSSMRAFAKRAKVRPHIDQVYVGSGEEEIRFTNGSRVLFGARERGFGLGFTNVGVLVFDEAQRLTDTALDDMIPTMNTAANPLPLFTGTPPRPSDSGEVFSRKRRDALAGEDTDILFIELSADRGCNPMDRKQWAKANPSYPRRTPDSAMLRMMKQLTAESFIREALGIWDEDGEGVISLERWDLLGDRDSLATDESFRIALDATPSPRDKRQPNDAWFSSAGLRPKDSLLHVQVRHHVPPTQAKQLSLKDRVVDLAVQLTEGHGVSLILPPYSPAHAWKADLIAAGVELDEMTATEYAAACGRILDAVTDGSLRHRNQPEMNRAVEGLSRNAPDDLEAWTKRPNSSSTIAPFIAATCALARVPAEARRAPRIWSLSPTEGR